MSEQVTISTRLWLDFLWSFAAAYRSVDDATLAVRAFARKAGLPEPPSDLFPDDWLDWLHTEHGLDIRTAGIHRKDDADGR